MHSLIAETKIDSADDALLRAALSSMDFGFSVWSERLELILFNPIFEEMFYSGMSGLRIGMSLRELSELSFKNGNHEGCDADAIYEMIRRPLIFDPAKPAPQQLERMIKGRLVQSLHTFVPGVGCIVRHTDITDARERETAKEQYQLELQRHNRRLDATVESIPHGMAMFDADNKLVTCNSAFGDINRIDEELLVPGTDRSELVESSIRNGFAATAAGKQYFKQREVALRNREASAIMVELTAGQFISATQHPIEGGGWVLFQQDITELHQHQKTIEARSEEAEQQSIRFGAAVNNMSHGLSMFDANGALVVCNQAYQALYKLPPELTKPGVNFWSIFDHRSRVDMVSEAPEGAERDDLDRMISEARSYHGPVRMRSGTVVMIKHQPMADGGWLSTHDDITEHYKYHETITRLARFDSLTKLPNRNSFLEVMGEGEAEIAAGKTMAVMCIDLDKFKPINDQFGHAAGDAVLRMVADRISSHVGDDGRAARLGGDEFAALVGPVSGPEDAGKVAQKLLDELSMPFLWEGIEVSIGACIGIAMAPSDGDDSETLLRHGDLALYSAKKHNRGGYCFFERHMDEVRRTRRSIEAGLRTAIERDEISLNFQPLISLGNQRISCCEALMRWNRTDHGMVSPADFIPIAEETGLIRDLGNWALRHACEVASKWPNDIRVAVNVSPVQFSNADLVQEVRSALEHTGLAPQRLELEITESLFLADNDHNMEILHALKYMGVRIALDDFGTGYSSLSYLRNFPFDKIKIDRSFVSSIVDDSANRAIVKAVTDLGHALDMGMTAEGIETELQLNTLGELGCDEVQGFLFSPPLPSSAINSLLDLSAQAIRTRRTEELARKKA